MAAAIASARDRRECDMLERHFTKLRARDTLSDDEEHAIRGAIGEVREHPADHVLINPGVDLKHSTLLLDGIRCRYKDLRNGQRQITELHVPGDFADLHSFTLKRLDHAITALTPCRIATVPHLRLTEVIERLPDLTRLYWFATNLDAAIHREWELSLGRRTARAKLAMLFCELFVRTLKELRTSELVKFQDGRVTILDWTGLARAGEFELDYLYLERRDR